MIKTYTQNSSAIGKPKTPEEMAKSKAEKDQLNQDIESMVKTLPKFDDTSSAKSKIQNFI